MSGITDVVGLLRDVSQQHPDVDAFVEADGTRLSYGEWDRAADGIAAALADRGVGRGDVVCLLVPSSARYMICYQATVRLGAITTGINQRLGASERAAIVQSARPVLAIVDDDGDAPADVAVARWSDLAAWTEADAPALPRLNRSDIAVLCWTGGTTGRPKGVMFDHDNMRAVAAAAGALSARFDRRLSPLSFAHVGTMTRAWDEISRVMTTVLTPPHWTAADALRLIGTERITVAQGVPTQWELMLRHPDFERTDRSALRLAATGGSRVPMDLLQRMRAVLGVPVINRYASTEAAVIAGSVPGDPDELIAQTVGRAGPGISIRTIGDDGRVLGVGEVGRVQVRSAAVMRGYWQDPAATAQAVDADGWLTVGDLGRLDEDGYLSLVGRLGEMFVRGGYNIYPIEVERVLAEHQAVRQASVIARRDSVLGEAAVAFVVMDDAVSATDEQLRGWVRSQLADYKTPDEIVRLPELPVTTLGKVDRRVLAGRAEAFAR